MQLTLLSGLWSSGRLRGGMETLRRILPLLLFLLVIVAGSTPLMAAEEELKLRTFTQPPLWAAFRALLFLRLVWA